MCLKYLSDITLYVCTYTFGFKRIFLRDHYKETTKTTFTAIMNMATFLHVQKYFTYCSIYSHKYIYTTKKFIIKAL